MPAHSVLPRRSPHRFGGQSPCAPAGEHLRRWLSSGLDVLFPPRCAVCGAAGHLVCPTCAQQVEPVPAAICAHCGRVQPAATACCTVCEREPSQLLQIRAAGLHTWPLRELIHLLKYEQRPDLAPALARYLAAALAQPAWDGLRDRFDAVAPVPLHPERRRERGYNQAELLAAALCRRCCLPLRIDLIQRSRQTEQQVGLSAHERRINVEGAFTAAAACQGLRLLLIDDVFTTGATLNACADAAVAAGAVLVCGLALAIPVHG